MEIKIHIAIKDGDSKRHIKSTMAGSNKKLLRFIVGLLESIIDTARTSGVNDG